MVFVISLFSALLALLTTRWLARIAPAQREPSVVPITYRPGSASPVPRVGGIAVFAAALAAVGLAVVLHASGATTVVQHASLYGGVLGGAALLLAIGLADDFLDLSPAVKLLAQGMAAMFVVSGGLVVRAVQLGPHTTVMLGWVGIPLTLFWIIAVTNAFNFIDGLDGLASSIGIVGFIATSIAAAALGHVDVMLLSVAMLGALFGFLRYNIAPARIYLGDCGSLLIGYLLATLSLLGATSSSGATLAYIPLFALAIPLLDASIAIARRWLRRMPVWKGDHRHIHHRVLALGLTKRQSVGVLVVAATVLASMGIATSFAPPQLFATIALVAAVITLSLMAAGFHRLEYYEFSAVRTAIRLHPSSWRRFVREEIRMYDAERELATARDLNELRTGLDRCALAFGLDRIEISRQRPHPRRSWHGEYLDVPVSAPTDSAATDGWVLRVWHGEYDSPRPDLVQRSAQMLAGACGRWLQDDGLLGGPSRTTATNASRGQHLGPSRPRKHRHLVKT